MAEDSGVRQISGRAIRRPQPALKRKEDVRPCMQGGCKNEGSYIPTLTIWSKNDPQHLGRFVVDMVPLVLCESHASTSRADYVPSAEVLERLRGQLRSEADPTAEPDIDTMVIQFFGNSRCKVEHAKAEAAKASGAFEPGKVVPATRVTLP